MKKIKKAMFIILGVLAALVLGVLALIYIPSPKFEPLAYEPIAPDYWPTEGFLTSTPNEIAECELVIHRDIDCYKLAWIKDGEVTGYGIGMEVKEGLAAGWH